MIWNYDLIIIQQNAKSNNTLQANSKMALYNHSSEKDITGNSAVHDYGIDSDDFEYEYDDQDYVEYDEIYPASNMRGCGGGGGRNGNKGKEKNSIYSSRHTRLQAQNRSSNKRKNKK